jgi:hypothetical protein
LSDGQSKVRECEQRQPNPVSSHMQVFLQHGPQEGFGPTIHLTATLLSSPTSFIVIIIFFAANFINEVRYMKSIDFRLGQFHDDLIRNGSLPLSIVEWIMLDDRSSIDQALK